MERGPAAAAAVRKRTTADELQTSTGRHAKGGRARKSEREQEWAGGSKNENGKWGSPIASAPSKEG